MSGGCGGHRRCDEAGYQAEMSYRGGDAQFDLLGRTPGAAGQGGTGRVDTPGQWPAWLGKRPE